jgi:hypothetical protein
VPSQRIGGATWRPLPPKPNRPKDVVHPSPERRSARVTASASLARELLLWALVGSNHRPPPCKGAPRQAVYLVKRASAHVRATSRFESLLSFAVRLNAVCVLFCLICLSGWLGQGALILVQLETAPALSRRRWRVLAQVGDGGRAAASDVVVGSSNLSSGRAQTGFPVPQ